MKFKIFYVTIVLSIFSCKKNDDNLFKYHRSIDYFLNEGSDILDVNFVKNSNNIKSIEVIELAEIPLTVLWDKKLMENFNGYIVDSIKTMGVQKAYIHSVSYHLFDSKNNLKKFRHKYFKTKHTRRVSNSQYSNISYYSWYDELEVDYDYEINDSILLVKETKNYVNKNIEKPTFFKKGSSSDTIYYRFNSIYNILIESYSLDFKNSKKYFFKGNDLKMKIFKNSEQKTQTKFYDSIITEDNKVKKRIRFSKSGLPDELEYKYNRYGDVISKNEITSYDGKTSVSIKKKYEYSKNKITIKSTIDNRQWDSEYNVKYDRFKNWVYKKENNSITIRKIEYHQ